MNNQFFCLHVPRHPSHHGLQNSVPVSSQCQKDSHQGQPSQGCWTWPLTRPGAQSLADQLTDVLVNIFNTFLTQADIPECFKATMIRPGPKKATVSELNNYRPVALTPIIMKFFVQLVLSHIKKNQLPPTLDRLRFAYLTNRSADGSLSYLHFTWPCPI